MSALASALASALGAGRAPAAAAPVLALPKVARPASMRSTGSSSRRPSSSATDDLVGGLLTWLKAISLICLVCWVVSWLVDRRQGAGRRPRRAGSTIWASPAWS